MKFTDKLTEQALELALDNHAKLTERQRQLIVEKDALVTEIERIQSELAEQEKTPSLYGSSEVSIDEINKALNEQTAKVDALNKALSEGKGKLPLLRRAIVRIPYEIQVAENQIKDCRAALAASFERHILSTREFKNVIPMLRKAWAAWSVTAACTPMARFDYRIWAGELVEEPTEKDLIEARKLLRIAND